MRLLRILALISAVSLFLCSLPLVSAADGSSWTELLEYTSISPNGENWFTFNGTTASFTLPLHNETRLAKIDMLIWHQSSERITAATVTSGDVNRTLYVQYIGGNFSRVYGNIQNAFYDELLITFYKSSSTNLTWELMSCKVTALNSTDFPCDAEFNIIPDAAFVACPGDYDYEGDGSTSTNEMQFPIIVYDWQKYDYITVTGSLARAGLNSVRATIGNTGLPYDITYTSTNATGERTWSSYHQSIDPDIAGDDYTLTGTEEAWSFLKYDGKVLYNITVDLRGMDRTSTHPLYIYFTGVYNGQYGYRVQVVGATGSIITADRTGLAWWNRFTGFMKDVFVTDTTEAEEYREEAADQREELDGLNDQLDDVEKPDVGDIQMDIDNYVDIGASQSFARSLAALTGNQLLIRMMCITLTIALVGYVLYGKR